MSTGAVILAGGAGERFGKKKQFLEFQGKPLWRHVYEKCIDAQCFEEITIVGVDNPGKQTYPEEDTDVICVPQGGKTRQESVFWGLHRTTTERIVILEAARPLVTIEQIVALADHPGESVSYIAPAVETILFRGEHLDRNECEILQVPQAFDAGKLINAHMMTCATDATDDTILMWEIHGIKPDLVTGARNLHKVTYPHDIKILEQIHEDLDNGR